MQIRSQVTVRVGSMLVVKSLLPVLLLLRWFDQANHHLANFLGKRLGSRLIAVGGAMLGGISMVLFFSAGWFMNAAWPGWLIVLYTWGHMIGVTSGSCFLAGYFRGVFAAQGKYKASNLPPKFWQDVVREQWDLLLNNALANALIFWAVSGVAGTFAGDIVGLCITGLLNYAYGNYRDAVLRSESMDHDALHQEAGNTKVTIYCLLLASSIIILCIVAVVGIDIAGLTHLLPASLQPIVKTVSAIAQNQGKTALRLALISSFIVLGAHFSTTAALLKGHPDLRSNWRVIAYWVMLRLNWNWLLGMLSLSVNTTLNDLKTRVFGIDSPTYHDKVQHLYRIWDRLDTGRPANGLGRIWAHILTEISKQGRLSLLCKYAIGLTSGGILITLLLLNI